jgi:hypothetical protein
MDGWFLYSQLSSIVAVSSIMCCIVKQAMISGISLLLLRSRTSCLDVSVGLSAQHSHRAPCTMPRARAPPPPPLPPLQKKKRTHSPFITLAWPVSTLAGIALGFAVHSFAKALAGREAGRDASKTDSLAESTDSVKTVTSSKSLDSGYSSRAAGATEAVTVDGAAANQQAADGVAAVADGDLSLESATNGESERTMVSSESLDDITAC